MMFCAKCGGVIADGVAFCPNCGTPVAPQAPQQPVYQAPQQPVYQAPQQPVYQAPQQPVYAPAPEPQQPALGMKWFKFLIYFGLFAGAVLNLSSGIQMLTGDVYGKEAGLVYAAFPDLKTLDVIVGVCLLLVAVLGVIARFRLSGYHKNGPAMLNATYLAVAAVELIYVIGVHVILPEQALNSFNFSSTFSSIAMALAMVSANSTYFKKRKHLFVK